WGVRCSRHGVHLRKPIKRTWRYIKDHAGTDTVQKRFTRPHGMRAGSVPRYLATCGLAAANYFTVEAASADAGSAGAGSVARAGAAAGVGARCALPANGTLPDAPIARGCSSSATSPLQPV